MQTDKRTEVTKLMLGFRILFPDAAKKKKHKFVMFGKFLISVLQ